MSPFKEYIKTELISALVDYNYQDEFYEKPSEMLANFYSYKKHIPKEKEALKLFSKYIEEIKLYIGPESDSRYDREIDVNHDMRYAYSNFGEVIFKIITTQMIYAISKYFDPENKKLNTVKRIKECILTQGIYFYDWKDLNEKERANNLFWSLINPFKR